MAASRWEEGMEEILCEIETKCSNVKCHLKSGRSTKPVVAMPRATRLNQLMTLDLKVRHKKRPILYIIDCFTRLTVAEIIENKKPKTVAEVIIRRWVGSGYGTPAAIHSDNGKEFTGQELVKVAEYINAMATTTAGYTPYQNGLNERGHSVVDRMMELMMESEPKLDKEICLYWAVNAKNCLQMWQGLSSYQLVFGKNPELPSNVNSNPPGLEGKTTSELFADQLTAMNLAREAFIKIESDGRLKKALRHNVRPTGDQKEIGDVVFFKRSKEKDWRGPGKVIGVDGLNILVKQSSSIYNVKSDEAVRVGEEFWSIPAPLKAEKKKRVMEEATVEVQQHQPVRSEISEISEGLNEVREESTVVVGQDKSGNNQT